MCGIVGYIGPKNATEVLLEGLRRLEYRGYDSAGIAVISDGDLDVRRSVGKITNLDEAIRDAPMRGNTGVGHTRWATHGKPSEENAHPHQDCPGKLVVVHNGIIENYRDLRQELVASGHTMVSETDTEVIVHLVESHLAGDLEEAVRKTIRQLKGVYALTVMHADDPDLLVAARSGPPLVVGIGDGEMFIASDIPAVLHHTRRFVYMDDEQISVITREGVRVTDLDGARVEIEPVTPAEFSTHTGCTSRSPRSS